MPEKGPIVTVEPKQEQHKVARRGNVLVMSTLFGVSVILGIIALMGIPLFGSAWISPLLLVAILIVMWILSVTSTIRTLSDLRMLESYQQHPVVREVMDVKVALEEEGVRTYRGLLRNEAPGVFDYLSRQLEPEDALLILEPDPKLGASITVISRGRRRDLQPRKINWALHSILFVFTLITTTTAGAGYLGANVFSNPEQMTLGIPYALALMTILGLHEAGHYFVARNYQMNVTPPYFLPGPFPLGTFGAFISMHSPSRNRQVMFDTAVAGPLIGLLVSVIVLSVGLMFTEAGHSVLTSELLSPRVGDSILLTLIALVANPSLPYHQSLTLHPLAFAGWLGLLITAINLFPAGQLDGGHLAQSMFGPIVGNIVSLLTMIGLFALALFVWPGLLLFAFFVLLIAGGTDRPLNNLTALDKKRQLLGAFAFVCLFAILVPMPAAVYQWLVGL